MPEPDVPVEVCAKCTVPFTIEDEQGGKKVMMFSSETCFHTFHKKCFKEHIVKNYGDANCPQCGVHIGALELNTYLTEEENTEV